MTTQPEPSDATRFATRPKQRRKELVNATDNRLAKLLAKLAKLRGEARAVAMAALAAPDEEQLKSGEWLLMLATPGNPAKAHRVLEEGMWRQWVEDDRTLDPETVAEQFTRAEREYTAAIHNRAVIRAYGVVA
jgi:hypothetical protein